jgi:hypothetical protein
MKPGFEDDFVPKSFEPFYQAMGRANGIAFVEVSSAGILVGGGSGLFSKLPLRPHKTLSAA